jgi:hypothetical protein
MPFLDLWYEVFGLLDIDEALAICKAHPRLFGTFIKEKQGIRFRNAVNSYMRSAVVDFPVGPLSSFVCSVLRDSSLEFSDLLSCAGSFRVKFLIKRNVFNQEDSNTIIFQAVMVLMSK